MTPSFLLHAYALVFSLEENEFPGGGVEFAVQPHARGHHDQQKQHEQTEYQEEQYLENFVDLDIDLIVEEQRQRRDTLRSSSHYLVVGTEEVGVIEDHKQLGIIELAELEVLKQSDVVDGRGARTAAAGGLVDTDALLKAGGDAVAAAGLAVRQRAVRDIRDS